VVIVPKLAILAADKLPRFLDGLSLLRTFDALDARKVSILAKGVDAIPVHELHSAGCEAQAKGYGLSPPTPGRRTAISDRVENAPNPMNS
jgi:hypothetical protein